MPSEEPLCPSSVQTESINRAYQPEIGCVCDKTGDPAVAHKRLLARQKRVVPVLWLRASGCVGPRRCLRNTRMRGLGSLHWECPQRHGRGDLERAGSNRYRRGPLEQSAICNFLANNGGCLHAGGWAV